MVDKNLIFNKKQLVAPGSQAVKGVEKSNTIDTTELLSFNQTGKYVHDLNGNRGIKTNIDMDNSKQA